MVELVFIRAVCYTDSPLHAPDSLFWFFVCVLKPVKTFTSVGCAGWLKCDFEKGKIWRLCLGFTFNK